MTLAESTVAVVARNETWGPEFAATEPYEAGWAREILAFVRALDDPAGSPGIVRIEISPDGMHWVAEGTQFEMPASRDSITFGRISHYGNWIRLRADIPQGGHAKVLVTFHCKS